MAVIKTENLTKYYGKARGINDVSLVVDEGDIFGFIGPNGAGKSTFIRTILGLIFPTSGRAEIFGMDVSKSRVSVLSGIGYMPSEALFYDGMRVGEIISYSARLYKKDCSDEAVKLCKRLDLDTKKKIEDLSLGNRKKVAIVCAFQHNPDLYILDEPTSGLDPLMQSEFFSIIKERQSNGATVFLSSHVLSEIQRYCRNAAIIRDGKIIVSSSVEELSKTSARRVVLHGVAKAPEIKGVIDEQVHPGTVSFLFQGDIKDLISALNGMPVTDISVSEPDLEEIFMHFYSGKEEK